MKNLFVFSLAFVLSIPWVSAQTSFEAKTLQWNDKSDYPNFKQCVYQTIEDTDIPMYVDRLNVPNAAYRLEIISSSYVPATNAPDGFSSAVEDVSTLKQYITYQKGKPILNVLLNPYRLNGVGQLEQLQSFRYRVVPTQTVNTKSRLKKAGSFASSSVLVSGDWFRFKISKDGLYKITGEQFTNLNIDVNSINLNTVKVFAHGGGMLPEVIEDERTDDLKEIALEIVDGDNNGILNTNDFIRFYAEGPSHWEYNGRNYKHFKNLYSDYAYVYLTIGGSAGKRIVAKGAGTGESSDTSINSYRHLVHHEVDEVNFIQSGREWYGNEFRVTPSQNFQHSFSEVRTDLPAYFSHRFAARSVGVGTSSNCKIRINQDLVYDQTLSWVAGDYDETFARIGVQNGASFSLTGNNVNINYSHVQFAPEGNAWIDYYSLEIPRTLTISGNQSTVLSGEAQAYSKVKYAFKPGAYTIWNVSDFSAAHEQRTASENSLNTAIVETNSKPTKFLLFQDGSEIKATFDSKVETQNLHQLSGYDYLIITKEIFKDQAIDLANFHESQYEQKAAVVLLKDIYNEFSAGKQDPVAIRDFIRMIYSRGQVSGKPLDNVLLLGDGSYDFKDRIDNNTNLVPTFQSRQSIEPVNSYSSDDFYAILDEPEGHYDESLRAEDLDIGIGRIPCRTVDQARTMVDKIKHYHDPSTFGDWQNRITFLGDDEDGNSHVIDSENASDWITGQSPVFNQDKIYLDAYEQQSFGSGEKYPDVNLAVTKSFERGNLIFNYLGHGGSSGMAHERVVTRDEIRGWNNYDMLPLMVTATCELSRFDDPAQDSPGELMLFNKRGGAMGLVTTMRLVRITLNTEISRRLWNNNILNLAKDHHYLGEIFIRTKNTSSLAVNQRNFSLLGDPGIELSIPDYTVSTTHINDVAVGSQNIDTFQAFSKMKIDGVILDDNGVFDSTFNGFVYPTVFDKFLTYRTLENDPESHETDYDLQNSVIYRGKVSVFSGKFSFQFVVPKDIAYQFGNGKISYFAENGAVDAHGYDQNILVGGSITQVADDQQGPDIELFMNDRNWVFGGTTDPNPMLICDVFDENGINTVGNGIGRDITAVLDAGTDNERIIVLNDFYQSKLDSYQEGEIQYQMEDLSPGKHTLKVRVWDVYNNVSEDNTEFIVAEESNLAINNLINFPNPFTGSTTFHFDHNKAGQGIDVLVQITTVSGRIVKSFTSSASSANGHFDNISWDGRDEFGDQLARGVYLYKVTVKSEDGQKAEKTQKLVILK